MLFGEPTWFCVVHPNLDPTLGVAMGVKGVYRSMLELSHRKLIISISHFVVIFKVILVSEPDAMLILLSSQDSQKSNMYRIFKIFFTTKIVLMKKKYINMILWLDNWKFEIGFSFIEHVVSLSFLRKVQQNYNKTSIF